MQASVITVKLTEDRSTSYNRQSRFSDRKVAQEWFNAVVNAVLMVCQTDRYLFQQGCRFYHRFLGHDVGKPRKNFVYLSWFGITGYPENNKKRSAFVKS